MKKALYALIPITLVLASLYGGYVFLFAPVSEDDESDTRERSKIHLAVKSDIVSDEESGQKIEKGVILITFTAFADEVRAREIIKDVGGKIVGYILASNFYQVKIPGADLQKTKDICHTLLKNYKEVETATLNRVTVEDNPYWSAARNQ